MKICAHHKPRQSERIHQTHPQNEDLPEFFPSTFTQCLFSLDNSRTIWQVGPEMFMAVLVTPHLQNAVWAGAWGDNCSDLSWPLLCRPLRRFWHLQFLHEKADGREHF